MGKARRERKGAKDEDSDLDLDADDLELNNKNAGKKSKTSSKSKGKEKKNADMDDSDSDGVSKVTKGFTALDVEDADEEDMNAKNRLASSKEQGKKGKKSKKKRNDSSDEDIEKMLAELEMEYAGIKKEDEPPAEEIPAAVEEEQKKEKKKEKKKEVEEEEADEETSTVKSAAQKKKDKKEREKQKKLEARKDATVKKQVSKADSVEKEEEKKPAPAETIKEGKDDKDKDDDEEDAKKKLKKKTGKEEKETKTKGPGKKQIAAMQEALKKIQEEKERFEKEEKERIRREEAAEKERLEQLRLEQEKKEKKKKKEKERKERLKAEGKFLTTKQKADRARAQAMIESLKAQGIAVPEVGEKKVRYGTRVRPSKSKTPQATPEKVGYAITDQRKDKSPENEVAEEPAEEQPEKPEDKPIEEEEEDEDDVKDSWDVDSNDETDGTASGKKSASSAPKAPTKKSQDEVEDDEDDEDEDESSNSGDSSEEESGDESGSSEDESEDEKRTDAEKKMEKAKARIKQRREEAEKNKTLDSLRAAVICVLGHVDTGKTKILDKLRRTHVQDGEAGGITQQIGATNVPLDAIKEQIKIVKGFADMKFKIPGLLIIDTPGHESFSNLRSRGSSLCDMAILVVDIMHGLEPQTIESINLLKARKTPFIVALNKIDRLYDWQTMSRKDIRDVLDAQSPNTKLEFEQRAKEAVLQLAEQGLNAALFYENPDVRTYVSLVPTSAITGDGMGNLLALIVESSQTMLAKRLMYSDELQATVLEVKVIPGLGTTIDVILVNGTLREGDTMVTAGTDGPVVTQIRSLLMPQPMKELRVKNAYVEYKEVKAAQGVKIAAKELEKAIAGLNLMVAHKPDEVEVLREEVAHELKKALSSIKLQERGVYVQASTLGSLEALLDFLRSSKIPYSGIRIGPVVKKDVMRASIMLEHDSQYATILAFDVKIEKDAQDLADSLGVKIFQADIIYHLFDRFMAYREELKQKKREEFKHVAVFPCKLRVLPQYVFNSRDPIVVGVMVEAGIVREGTPICVPSKEFLDIGIVTSIENNHKTVESARKGQEICIKIEPIPGESPKMFGRHFDEKDFLISKISRQSIDACKDYFRDDLVKTDWQLMVELKKLFQIM